jgi:hypothetical protein
MYRFIEERRGNAEGRLHILKGLHHLGRLRKAEVKAIEECRIDGHSLLVAREWQEDQ